MHPALNLGDVARLAVWTLAVALHGRKGNQIPFTLRRTRRATAPVAAFTLLAWAGSAEAGCRLQGRETLILNGLTDAALRDCVSSKLTSAVSTVIVTSAGGPAADALGLAELFSGRKLDFRVRRYCNSSCANYLLPTARSLTLEPGSIILLHGGIDERHVKRLIDGRAELIESGIKEGLTPRAAAAAFEQQVAQAEAVRVEQRAFSLKHQVRPGWHLYRSGPDLTVDIDRLHLDGSERFLLAEEALIRTCLPAVTVHPFQLDLARRILSKPARAAQLKRQGVAFSGEGVCSSRSYPGLSGERETPQ